MKQKFLLATVIISLFTITTKAQIAKGSVWLGGGIGYRESKMDNSITTTTKEKGFNFNPGIGKAIKDNTIAGVDIIYAHAESDITNSNSDNKINTYGAGIFVRRYVPIINRFYIFGQARAGYSFTKQKYREINEKYESWSTGLNFYPGISFAVNNKLHLESGFTNLVSIQYGHSKSNSNLKSNSFSAGVNLDNSSSFYLGFRLLINNKG